MRPNNLLKILLILAVLAISLPLVNAAVATTWCKGLAYSNACFNGSTGETRLTGVKIDISDILLNGTNLTSNFYTTNQTDALLALKLNITDQRYNDTFAIEAVNQSLIAFMLKEGNNSNITALYFNLNPNITSPITGTLYWDVTNKVLALQGEAWTLQIGEELYIIVYNDKAYNIENGIAVTQDGAIGSQPTVAPADSSSITTGIILGLATQTILPGQTGMITLTGVVHGLNTSMWTPGTILYSDSTGHLTDVQPSPSPAYPMTIGKVLMQDEFVGSVLVRPLPAEVDPIWQNDKGNYYNVTQIDGFIYGTLKNTTLVSNYLPYSINGTLASSPISYQVTDEQFIEFFNDRSMYLDSTNGVGGVNIPASESHKSNWQVTSKMVPGTGLLTTGAYDPFNDETIVTNTVDFGDNIDSSSNIFVNNISHFVTTIPINNTLYVRGNVSFTNQPFIIRIAPYADVFGPSNTERGYSISDDSGNWQWAMYIPDDSNNTELCFQNRIFPNGNLFCLHDNGDVNVIGTLFAQGLDLGNSSITVVQVNAQVLNGTVIYLNNTDLQTIINNIYLGLDTKLNITDQRYNDTVLIQAVNNSALHNSGPQLLNGTLTILGNLNVIGSYVNLTVTQQDINGSIYPVISGLFDLGSATQIWNNVYANTLHGNLNASYIQNPYWLNMTDQRYNDTALIQALNNSLQGQIDNKLNTSDQRYNDTASIQALNSSLQGQINTKVGGTGTSGTLTEWNGTNNLIDSPIKHVITDEDYLDMYDGLFYMDDTNDVAGINVVPGSESHEATFSVNTEWSNTTGITLTAGAYNPTFDYTDFTSNNLLPESLTWSTNIEYNNTKYFVFNYVNRTLIGLRGNHTGLVLTNWQFKPAPYNDVNGESTDERGFTISTGGHWKWAIYTPADSNDTQLCFQSTEFSNVMCIQNDGQVIVNGVLTAGSVQFPKYAGFDLSNTPTDNGGGTVAIPSNFVNCYTGNDYGNTLTKYAINSGVTGSGGIPSLIAGPNTLNYIIADCGASGTTPTFTVVTDPSIIDNVRYQIYSIILLGTNNTIHIQNNLIYGTGLAGRGFTRTNDVEGYAISLSTPLNLQINNSFIMLNNFKVWAGYTPYNIPQINNLTKGIYIYTTNGTTFAQFSMPPKINDSVYQNGTGGLVPFDTGYYGIIDVWRLVENSNEIYMRPMNKEYVNLAAAQAETSLTPIPSIINQYGVYIGRIIFQSGNTSNQYAQTFSAANKFVTPTPTTDHNSLSGLQGGSANQYYHLTQSDYNNVVNSIWLNATDQPYNDTAKINAVNTTTNIQGLGFNTTAQLNTLYYSITNPNGYINSSGLVAAVGNWSFDKQFYSNTTADYLNDSLSWYSITNPKNYQNDTQVNNSINAALATTFYIPNTSLTITGTNTGGNNVGNLSFLDEQKYNTTRSGGGGGFFDIRANFTNITQFNALVLQLTFTSTSTNSRVQPQFWDCNSSTWEADYGDILSSTASQQLQILVPDGATHHICNGTVQVRLLETAIGSPADAISIDLWNLAQGIVIPAIGQDRFVTNFINNDSNSDVQPLIITLSNGQILEADVLLTNKLNITDQRYNDTILANSKAAPGNCPAGQLVQNTTTGGVQCLAAGTGTVTSINFTSPGLIGGLITASGTVTLNTTYLSTLYYNISNPIGYLNATGVVTAVGNWSADKINYYNITTYYANATATFVPYNGATSNTDLGAKNLTTTGTINSRGTYAEMQNSTAGGTLTMTTQNVFYNISGMAIGTNTIGVLISGYRLNITEAGTYVIEYVISAAVNNNDVIGTQLTINGVADTTSFAINRWSTNLANQQSFRIYRALNAGDIVALQIQDQTRNGAVITFTNRIVTVNKIGN